MSDIRRRIYNDLSQDYDAGSFEDFTSRIENEESRKKVYNALSEKFDMGSFDEFSKQLGFGNEQKTEPTSTPKPSLEVKQDNVQNVKDNNKFGTQFKPLKPEIQTIVNPNITTFADQTPQEYAVGVKEGFKQGSKALGAGLQNIAGEALNVATGSSRDDAGALAKMEQMEVVEKQPLLSKAERKMHAMYADDGGNNRIAMVQGEDGKLRRITDEERQKHKDILLQDEYNKIINEAIDEAGGDVVKAKEILSERAADKTAGDKLIEAAGDKMATIKPTKGFGAWVGNIIPQMIPSTLGMGASLLTKNANVGKLIGGLTMGTMSAATAGQSMKEARDAGATSGQVWLTGLTDGLIEWATEQIPYDRYTKRLFNGTKSKINEALGKELAKEASPLKEELGDILKKANKELNGKLLNGKNVKDYISDIAAEGASEFTAEALQTITPIIYAHKEDYPTFKQIMEAGWEGAKAGVFMGAVLGGTSKSLEYAQNRNRRKQQGYVDVAQVQKDGETVIGEVLGLNKENGRIAMLIDGVSEEFEPANITESYRFTFEEFERGNIEKQQDESFEQGYDLVEPQQMNDAQLELEEAENEAIRAFGVNNIEDVDAALNDMPLSSVLSMVDSEEAQQQILNYLNAKARVEGMYQKVRDDIDSAVEESNKLIDSRVHEDTHMIQPATLKTEDRQVYVVSGNIKMFDDGSAVDPANSSKHIIVKDAATGKLEMLSPNDVLRVDEAIDPVQEKAMVTEAIRDEKATIAANNIDGVVPFNAGDEYVVMFDDGTQHTAKVLADNGDGNVQVQIDNEPQATVASKEQVQQMVNTANKARVAQNKQAQIEQEQVVEEQAQQEAEKPKYAEKDTITIRLDDGREVRGSISKEADADGNIEVFTEQPIDGDAKVAYFTEEELDGRVVMHNDQAIELPTPEPVTALSQIPMDENSEPLFEQAPASLTYDALVEMNEGDAAEALDTAQQMLAFAKKELKTEEKSTPKVGGNVMEIQKAKAKKKERLKPLQERVAYWESVVNEPTQRKAKKAETASLAEKDEAPKAEEVAEVAPQEVIEEVKQEVVETPVEEPVEETAPVAEEAEAVEQQEVEPTPVVEEVETQEPIEAVKQEVKRTIPVSGVEALWARREEFYDANDPISKELIDRIYEAHPEEHQAGEFEKYNRRLIEAAMKHKGHPVADEILKQVKEENTISYRENKRREPLRERVKQWEDSLGVKATVIESFDDITTEDAKAAITEGYTITGWVEDGKVFLYMPNIANKTEVDKTYLHEVVAHIGLERLMGKQAYNAFCQRVWDEVMTEEQRKEYIDYPNVDSEAMAAHEYMAHLAEDSSLEQTAWQKIVRIFKDALRALGVELRLTNEDIQNALVDSFKNLNEAARSIEAEGGVVDSKRGDVSFAVKDILKGAEREKAIKDLMRVTGRSRETVVKYIKAEESLARIILDENNVALLDLQVDESVPSIWENSDYPQGTVEFSNICRKRLPFTMIYQQLQKEFPDTVFDATTLETIRGILKENGEDVACGLCFVEDRRQLLGEIGQSFIDAVKGENTDINEKQKEALNTLKESGDNYTPNLYELLTLDGMKKLRREHPEVAVAFIKYNNARGMQAGRLFQAYSAYHRDILKFNKARVDKINNSGGLRIFSYSDFEAHHLIDLVQVLTDCSRKGVKVQGYTKVPEFAKAVKDTKMKLNRSLIAKGKGIVDADYVPQEGEAVSPNVINGKRLLLDTVEGIDVNHPDFFDSSSSANVGNIIVGISDEHIKQAMADPFVDYIIPFHSGIKEETLKQKGIGDWKNYKLEQLEKIANEKGKLVNADKHGVNIYTEVLSDDIKTEKQFVEKYLKVCKAKGWIPKFHRLLDTNKDGDFVYTKGYYKLLLDYKLFNKNGKILPQEVVSPIFDPAYNEKILNDYVEGEKAKAPNQEIYEKIKDTLKEQGKVSFRFIGEKGAANLDNAEEATTRIDNLAIAREMEEVDKSPRTIKTATGWERGADGKWRYEVDDEITAKTIRGLKGVGLKKIHEARSKRINDLDKFTYIVTMVGVDRWYDAEKIMATSWPEQQKKAWLDAYNIYKDDRDAAIRDVTQARKIMRELNNFGKGEFFLYEALGGEHPLFKEYPQMRDVKLIIKPYKGGKNMGGYNRLTNTIEIVDFRGIMENDKGEGTANTLTHEIQHVIQGIEGFARGGNVNMVNPNAVKERNEQAAVISEKIEALKAQEDKLWAERETLNKTFEDWYESHPEGEYAEMMQDEQMSEADKRYSEVDEQIKPLQDERIELEQQLNDLMRNTDTSLGIEGYKRLAGEVESRNVESRRRMSAYERSNSPAWLTEDVSRKDQIFIEDALDNSSESSESRVSFRSVTNPKTLAKLENSETMKVYRAMQVIDGKLYPPMSAKVNGELREPTELGVWEEAEENPSLADDKGYFKLDKGSKKSLKARYNPYIHTSTTPLNDQFSEAQDRPNLITVEVEIPVSELTSGYKAEKAKDAVGKLEWKAGVVQGKLSGTRTVILSRWDKPIRIVPDSEVADVIVDMFDGRDITMPSNVVTPSLRAELEKRGIPFVETDNQGKKVSFRITKYDNQFKELQSEYDALDKNDEQALNEWRNKKVGVVEGYLYTVANRFGMKPEIVVFNGAEDAQVQAAYERLVEAFGRNGAIPPSYEAFKAKSLDKKVFATYRKGGDIITLNISTKDEHNSKERYSENLHHENAHHLANILYNDKELADIWEDAAKEQNAIVEKINTSKLYKDKSDSSKGNEYLAQSIGALVREQKSLFLSFVRGKEGITADDVAKKLKIKQRKANFAITEILNGIKDEYQESRKRDENDLVGGVGNDRPLRVGGRSVQGDVQRRAERGDERGVRRGFDVANAATSLAEQLGTKVTIIENLDEIADADKPTLRAKRGAKAWYDLRTGEVVIVIPNATSVKDVQRSVLHEVVAHKGLRDVIGRERFDQFLDKVFRNADADTRRKITQLAAKNGWNFRVATEEYMADIAEEGFDARENRSFFEKVRDLFMDMLREAKIALGYNINDNDLSYMLWRTYQMQKSKGVMAAAEDVVMQQKLGVGNYRTRPVGEAERVNARFNEQLEKLDEDTKDKIVLSLGYPSETLLAAGVKNKPMKLYGAKVLAKMKKHGFDVSELKDLPRAVANPIAVFNNYETDVNRSILTELTTKDGNFLVSVKIGEGEDVEFNIITSVFGKGDSKIANWINKGFGVYFNKEKTLNYLHHSAPIAEALSNSELSSITKIVENFVNPTIEGEKNESSPKVFFRSTGKAQPAEQTKEDLQKAIDKLQKNVSKLRQTIKNAKEFRTALANLVAARVMNEVTDDIINVMGKSEFNGLVRQIREANARQEAEKPLERIEEIITDLKMKGSKQSIDRSLALKVQGETKSGVSIAKSVDDTTRQIITFLKDNISKPADKLDNLLEGKYDNYSKVIIKDVAEHYRNAVGAMYDVEAINQEIKELKEENTRIRLQRADLNKQGKLMAADELATILKQNIESISALETERLSTKEQAEKEYEFVNNALSSLLLQGKGVYKTMMFENMRNKAELIDMAIEDVDTGQTLSVLTKKPTKLEKAKKLIGNLLFTPANSLNYLLKRITINAPNGEGNMYDYFIRGNNGYVAAAEKAYEGYNEYKEELNSKAKDVFGKTYKDAIADSDKLSNVVITVKADKRQQEVPLTYGQAMYLYMVNKMADGKVKLNKMGIFDEQIELLKQSLPAEYITFADWLQRDFLPKRREKYNDTHLRIFGTQMTAIDNYVPMKVKKDETYQEVDGSKQKADRLPTSTTGSIINRKRNNVILDLTTNALDLMLSHGQEMEHWNAYSPVVRDMNALLSDTKFRNMLNNRKDGLHQDLKDASLVASEQFDADADKFSEAALVISKGVTASKIAFRLWTAMKQVLSFPAFIAHSASVKFQVALGKSLSNPYGAWKWGMDNLPLLHKRWAGRTMGNEKLAQISESTFGKIIDGIAKFGMMPNAFVDAVTCAIGAKAVYDYRLGEYQKQGFDDVEADRRAKIDATLAFNESQQSGEGLFLSKIQANKDIASVAISTFNNSNFGYLRKMLEGLREISRNRKAEESYLYKKYLSQGLNEPMAERLAKTDTARAKRTAYLTVAMYGFILNIIWTAGSNVYKYLFSDDDDEELKKDLQKAFVMAPIRNTAIGNMAESAVQGYDVNPFLLVGDINRLLDIIGQDEAKRWDYTIGYAALKLAAASGLGVDLETVVRLYEGFEGIISDKSLDIEDAMALVSAPRSQALIAARKPKQGESVAEYQERISKIERRIDDRVTDNLRKTWISNYYMYNLADKFGLSVERDDFGRVSIPEYKAYKEEAAAVKAREADYKKRGISKSDMMAFKALPEYKRMEYNKAVTSALTSLRSDLSAEDRAAKEAELYKNMESLLSEGEEQ